MILIPTVGKTNTRVWYDTNMAAEPQHLETIGHICVTLQKPYGAVRRALVAVGAEPAIVLNGVAHYGEAEVERAAEQLQQCRQCEEQGLAQDETPNDERSEPCRVASRRLRLPGQPST